MYKNPIPFIFEKKLLRNFLCYCFTVFFIISITTITGFSQTTLPPAVQEAINNGIIATKVPDYLLAIKYFEEARKAAPQSAEIFFNLGLAESKIPGRELRSIGWFGAYLSANPAASNASAVKEQIAVLNIKNQVNVIRLINMVQDAASQIAGEDESTGLADVVGLWVSFGDISAAIKAVNLINKKDIFQKGFALGDIADAQLEAGDIVGAQKTTDQIHLANHKCFQLLSLAATQLKNGDTSGAQKTLVAASITAVRIHADPDWGIESMKSKETEKLYQVAKAQAVAGDISGAQKTIDAIRESDVEYNKPYFSSNKIGALSAIFLAQTMEDDRDGAKKTFAVIQNTLNMPESEVYKDYSYSDIAEAQAKSGDITTASKTAELIHNPYINNFAQCAIASAQAKAGNIAGAQKTLTAAQKTVLLMKDAYQKTVALTYIAEAQIKAGDIAIAKKTLAAAQDSADLIKDEFYKSLANRDIAKAKTKAGINVITVTDWLKKLDDDNKIDDCPLKIEPFLDLESYLKSVVRADDSAKNIFAELKQSAEKIVNARNIVLQLLKNLNGN